ncbi:MAG: DUF6502 family protein [Xanthomonadales bacterium]|jgi:hypothetical protein|nr:DUF6502 family protein [Xanthomonadales bacterium]
MNSSAVAPPITSEKSERIIHAINQVTDAIAWLFCRFVTGQVLVESMKRSVVKYAWVQMQNTEPDSHRAKKSSLTRLAMYTGLDTRTIRKVTEQPMRATEENICIEAAILGAWAKDPTLRDSKTNEPVDIPIFGSSGTFEGLVQRYAGRGVSVRFVLERLEAKNNVEVIGKHFVRLLNADWHFFENGEDTFLEAAVTGISNLSKTILNNLNAQGMPQEKWVERRTYTVNIPTSMRHEAEKAINESLIKSWNEVREVVRTYERSVHEEYESLEILGAGFYYWRESLGSEFACHNNVSTGADGPLRQ